MNVTFLTGDAAWSDDGGDHVLTCKTLVPWQTSVWAKNGTVGSQRNAFFLNLQHREMGM